MDSVKGSFDKCWKIIKDIISSVEEEMDPAFKAQCAVQRNDDVGIKKRRYDRYQRLRESLKNDCYGDIFDTSEGCESDNNKRNLDNKKLGAIICEIMINEKAFCYDVDKANAYAKIKKSEIPQNEFNIWAASNIFANYTVAFFASLQISFAGTSYSLSKQEPMIEEIDSDPEKKAQYAKILRKNGQYASYPRWNNFDSFSVNSIIALARADIYGRRLDILLYSLQLWQIEMFTLERLITGRQLTP